MVNWPSYNHLLKKDGPRDWTGKTWASQQGYLCSNGHINQDTISSSVSYFQNKNLDVLTGFPFLVGLVNELESLGISDYELENLIENIKQMWIQDYKTCYNDK